MDLRRIQEMGGGTYLVSLPKAWVKRNNISRGATVGIEETADGRLLVSQFGSQSSSAKEVKVPYPAQYPELLINEVTGAYLLGYHLIVVEGKERISYHDRELLKNAVRQLVGLEIVEEDSRSMLVQFLLEPTTLEPEKIFRRMHSIARGMYADAITAMLERDRHMVKAVVQRDEELDRLYFLLVRLIRTAILDTSLASKYHLSPIDCLDYRVASNVLESVGDYAVDFAKNAEKIDRLLVVDHVQSQLRIISESLQKFQDLAVRAFLNRSAKDAREVITLYREITQKVRELEKAVVEESPSAMSMALATAASLDKIARCQVDIADLVAPVYPIIR